MVFCVMKRKDCFQGCEELVAIFSTKSLAEEYRAKMKDKGLYRISPRKVQKSLTF